ncbi:hypothetical protein ABZ686_16215 [Streptomyces sp. NPDC006992]|uniref:hypothetical protein n=1 Tax=Streptomyces sp. NPDC006992 TaxID=3155601 RepID=UPI0033FB6245
MGWTVLYIAFGIVALWLLGEALLQYKARLRWRLLAFTGFLGVVAGTALPSVVVIGLGIAAFAVGQTFVTLSVRSGFTAGWALGGGPGSSRRRRGGASPGPDTASLEVSDLRTHDPADTPAAGIAPVPDPVDDYGQQGYGHQEPEGWGGADGDPGSQGTGYGYPGHDTYGPYGPYGGYGGYGGYEEETSVFAPVSDQPPAHGDGGHGQYGGYEQYAGYQGHTPVGGVAGYPDHSGYQDQADHSGYQDQAGYQQYQDPYGGYGGQYGGDGYGYPQQPYQPQVPETPPGGVWVPQQREGGAPLPPAEPQPYGYDPYADDAAAQQPQPYPQQAPQYPQDYYGSGPY